MIKKKEKNKWQMLLTRKIPYRRSCSIYKGKRNSVETPWGVWKRYELFGEFHFAFNFLVAIVMKFQERGTEDISTEPSLISFIPQSRSSKLSLSSAELEHISFWWELFWDAVESILCLDLRGKASSDIIKKISAHTRQYLQLNRGKINTLCYIRYIEGSLSPVQQI